eukprot:10987715-Alexandrium_andersonii.AAC.1
MGCRAPPDPAALLRPYMASSPTVSTRSVELPAAPGAGSPQASRASGLPQKLGPCPHSRPGSLAACVSQSRLDSGLDLRSLLAAA